MKKESLLLFLKGLILLAPLPFGCVSGVWAPLCFLLFSLFAFLALAGPGAAEIKLLYQRQARWLALAFFGVLVFQLLPLPMFMVKWLSPGTARILLEMNGSLPAFHSLSLNPAESLLGLGRFLAYGLFFYALLRLDWNKRQIFSLFGIAVFSGVVQTIFGLLKLAQGNTKFFLFFYADANTPGFLRGTIYNPDHSAFYLELLFPIAVGLLFARMLIFDPGQSLKEKILTVAEDRRIVLLFVAAVLCAAGIYLSGCRAGIAVLVLSLLFFTQMSVYLRVHHFSAKKNLRLVFIFATLLAVFVGVQNTLNKFLTKGLETGRYDYWHDTVTLFKNFPVFGSGLGTFKYAHFLYSKKSTAWVTHAHNDYLESLAETGLAGSILFFLLLALLAFSLLRMWSARHHPEIKPLVLGVLTALFAAAFHSLFDFSLRVPANAFLFIMLLALGLKVVTHRREFGNEKR